MSNFHSTLNRREFMKGLALAGAGVGVAAVAEPAFHDLDEMASASQSVQNKYPWFVKERPYLDSTTEVQWENMQRFDGGAFDNVAKHVTPDNLKKMQATAADWKLKTLKEGIPGYTLRDYALNTSAGLRPYVFSHGPKGWFLGEAGRMETPAALGVPAWQGTPEENARMIRSAALFCGAAEVSFGEIIEGKTKQLINLASFDFPKMQINFEDVDKGYVVADSTNVGKVVIPNSFKNVIITTIRQPLEFVRLAPGYIARAGSNKAYDQLEITHYRLKGFLDGIGYQGLSGGSLFGMTCARPGWGTLFGLGELSRMMEIITVPEGPIIRSTSIIATNLPLPPSNPVDAGMNRFCYTCGRCANACPVGAIYKPQQPDFIRTPTTATAGAIPPDNLKPELFNNSPGYKRWPLDQFACRSFWTVNVASCAICQGSCVFSKYKQSTIHEVVKPLIASTGVFNNFFKTMDERFGYGMKPADQRDDWWDQEHVVPGLPNNNY